jgi:hypothetical protein
MIWILLFRFRCCFTVYFFSYVCASIMDPFPGWIWDIRYDSLHVFTSYLPKLLSRRGTHRRVSLTDRPAVDLGACWHDPNFHLRCASILRGYMPLQLVDVYNQKNLSPFPVAVTNQ